MEYLIRAVRESDLPRLIEVCKSHAEYERAEFDENQKEERLRQALFTQPGKLFCFVVESGGELVGYYSYTFDFSTWDAAMFLYLDCLYLEPKARGMRIGEKVIENLKREAVQNNCKNIQWQTPSFNARAIKFYQRIGGIGKDKVRFTLDLSQR